MGFGFTGPEVLISNHQGLGLYLLFLQAVIRAARSSGKRLNKAPWNLNWTLALCSGGRPACRRGRHLAACSNAWISV